MTMAGSDLGIAMITETFAAEDGPDRLRQRLRQAREQGAALAVLPELPLHPWSPAHRRPRDEDAEPPGGPRERIQGEAAREAGLSLLGGTIRRDPRTGARYNAALLFDAGGELREVYCKTHLPDEEGFWEAHHYRRGDRLPAVVDVSGFGVGIQICSDVNRPALSLALAAMGADLIVAPRATPLSSYPRWKLVLRANAVTCCCFVLSTNRPAGEPGIDVGGPSIAITPDGDVLVESEDRLAFVTLERRVLKRARCDYPGHLDVRADLYARVWSQIASRGESSGD